MLEAYYNISETRGIWRSEQEVAALRVRQGQLPTNFKAYLWSPTARDLTDGESF